MHVRVERYTIDCLKQKGGRNWCNAIRIYYLIKM